MQKEAERERKGAEGSEDQTENKCFRCPAELPLLLQTCCMSPKMKGFLFLNQRIDRLAQTTGAEGNGISLCGPWEYKVWLWCGWRWRARLLILHELIRSCCPLASHSICDSGTKINPETSCMAAPSWKQHRHKMALSERVRKTTANATVSSLHFALAVNTHPTCLCLTRHQFHCPEETLFSQQKQMDQPALFVLPQRRRFSAWWGGNNTFHTYYHGNLFVLPWKTLKEITMASLCAKQNFLQSRERNQERKQEWSPYHFWHVHSLCKNHSWLGGDPSAALPVLQKQTKIISF